VAALSFYPIDLPMKTLYPIILSFSLLIPFSPVGEYLWHHGQQTASGFALQTQNSGQSWWQDALSSQQQLVLWFQHGKQQGWQQIDTQVHTLQQELQQQGNAIQTGLNSGQDALQQGWQRSQQTLQQVTNQLWQDTVMLTRNFAASVQALPATIWPDDLASDTDTESTESVVSLAANTPQPTEP